MPDSNAGPENNSGDDDQEFVVTDRMKLVISMSLALARIANQCHGINSDPDVIIPRHNPECMPRMVERHMTQVTRSDYTGKMPTGFTTYGEVLEWMVSTTLKDPNFQAGSKA